MTVIVALGVCILIAGAGVGAYLLGSSSGADLDSAVLVGEKQGEREGAAQGRKKGVKAGFKSGFAEGRKQTFARSYRQTYKQKFTDTGLDAPAVEVPKR